MELSILKLLIRRIPNIYVDLGWQCLERPTHFDRFPTAERTAPEQSRFSRLSSALRIHSSPPSFRSKSSLALSSSPDRHSRSPEASIRRCRRPLVWVPRQHFDTSTTFCRFNSMDSVSSLSSGSIRSEPVSSEQESAVLSLSLSPEWSCSVSASSSQQSAISSFWRKRSRRSWMERQ